MVNRVKKAVCVMGPNGVGKTTFIDAVVGSASGRVYELAVGKMMRAKYPPSHFKGQANPKHTAEEAWQMCVDGIAKAEADPNIELILIDGQPRDIDQVHRMMSQYGIEHPTLELSFVLIHADREIRQQRVVRRSGDNLEEMKTAMERIQNDMAMTYEVLVTLLPYKVDLDIIDASSFGTIEEAQDYFRTYAKRWLR